MASWTSSPGLMGMGAVLIQTVGRWFAAICIPSLLQSRLASR
jgi:hypothetical protein